MSKAKTWSDILEQARKQNKDNSPYIKIPPIELLNTGFRPERAMEQLAQHWPSGVEQAIVPIAWSKDHVYVLVNDHLDNQYVASVLRGPPQCRMYFHAGVLSNRKSGRCPLPLGHEGDHK